MEATGKYNFVEQCVVLCFYAEDFDWSRVSISGVYTFDKLSILEKDFVEITKNDLRRMTFVYNITPTGEKMKAFKLDISKIKRHILIKNFSLNLSYMFLGDVDMQLYSSKYSFEVSFMLRRL